MFFVCFTLSCLNLRTWIASHNVFWFCVEGKICFEQMRNKSSSVHRWNNMDYDILDKIFMNLNVMDLISVVSQVCSSWRSACCDPILWKKLDLSIQISDSCIYAPLQSDAWSYSVSNNNRLMNILKTTSNLSQGNVTCLIFNFFEYVEDEHLV